jgi:hypothetical protein
MAATHGVWKQMMSKKFVVRALLLVSLFAGSLMAAGPLPSLNSKELAEGPYSLAHMLLEKTFLKVDVLTLDVRFSKDSQAKIAEIANGKSYSSALGQQVAPIAIKAERAVVQMRFLRDVSLDKWMDVLKDNIAQARKAGLISGALEKKVNDALPKTFAAIADRGYEKGDRLLYDVRPDSLRSAVVSKDGKVLVDKTVNEGDVARVVMAAFFAPESEFRTPLLRSLLKPRK